MMTSMMMLMRRFGDERWIEARKGESGSRAGALPVDLGRKASFG